MDSTKTQAVLEGLAEFPELSRATGTLLGMYTIKKDPGAKDVVHAACRQPAMLRENNVEKLHKMEEEGQIAKADQPTEWVNSMVRTAWNGKVGICIDPSDLNKVIKREHHPVCTVKEVISEIPNAKVFLSHHPSLPSSTHPLEVQVAKTSLQPKMLTGNLLAHYGQYVGGH